MSRGFEIGECELEKVLFQKPAALKTNYPPPFPFRRSSSISVGECGLARSSAVLGCFRAWFPLRARDFSRIVSPGRCCVHRLGDLLQRFKPEKIKTAALFF